MNPTLKTILAIVLLLGSAARVDAAAPSFLSDPSAPSQTITATSAQLGVGLFPNSDNSATAGDTTVTFFFGFLGSPPPTPIFFPQPADQNPFTGSALATATTTLTGLVPGVTYKFKVEAQNGDGNAIAEGSSPPLTFQTKSAKPYAETFVVENITTNSATIFGVVRPHTPTSEQTVVTFQWGLDPAMYTNLEPATESPLTPNVFGDYELVSLPITGLLPGKTYFYKVVAGNSVGVTDGADFSFTTLAAAPTILQINSSNETGNTAQLNAIVKPNGANTRVFFQYSTDLSYNNEVEATNSPLLASGAVTQNAGVVITGLTVSTTYNFRAKAVNTVSGTTNTVFSSNATFSTTANSDLPNVTTRAVDNIMPTSARGGGEIVSQGTSQVTAKGVCWNTDSTTPPDLSDTCADGSGASIGPFLADITGLTPDTLYYVRAYATNGAGTGYGSTEPFRTQEILAYVDPAGVCGNNTPCFDTVNFAVASVASGTEIRILTGIYDEDVTLGTDKLVILSGGWSTTAYAGKDGTPPSTIDSLTVEKGSVDIEDMILQNP